MDRDRIEFHVNASDLDKIILLIGLERIQQIGLSKAVKEFLLNLDAKPKQDLQTKKLILQCDNLEKRNQKLDIENRLLLVHNLHISPDLAVKVTNGTVSFDEIFRPKIEKEKSAGLDENGLCSECGHVHFSKAGGRNCTSSVCLCGIRG